MFDLGKFREACEAQATCKFCDGTGLHNSNRINNLTVYGKNLQEIAKILDSHEKLLTLCKDSSNYFKDSSNYLKLLHRARVFDPDLLGIALIDLLDRETAKAEAKQ
jgi:hypothetical protein